MFFSAGLMWQKLVKVSVRRKKRGKQIVPLATLRDTWQENFHKMYLMKNKKSNNVNSSPKKVLIDYYLIWVKFLGICAADVWCLFSSRHLSWFFLLVQSLNFRDVQII